MRTAAWQRAFQITLETDLNEMVVSDLPDKQFKIIFIKMLSELRTMHKLRISTKRQKTAKY